MSANARRFRAAVLGATGYVGGELSRLLLAHPEVELAHVASRSNVGEPLGRVWPQLAHATDRVIEPLDAARAAAEHDVVFFALPHGLTQDVIAPLFANGATPAAKLIDLSGDFRLEDANEYATHYGKPHHAPELLSRFVYGLSEWQRARIVEAHAVANPGCFATAITLALAPLASRGLLPAQVTVFAATGSTGSGNKPSATTHHPARATNFKLYKVLGHQHVPEIRMLLGALGHPAPRLSFIPASAPLTHGIFAVAHVLTDAVEACSSALEEAYRDTPFVRVVEGSPELNHVVGSNQTHLGVTRGEGEVVIAAAIDNTLKGAAGQAVQNMNLMLGLPETSGLAHLCAVCR